LFGHVGKYLGQGMTFVECHRSPGVATGRYRGMERDLANKWDAHLGGQAGTTAGAEQGVRGAVLAGEVAHVLDDAGHPQVALAGHIRGAGRHLLGGHGRRRHHDDLGTGQHPGQAHLDVSGPGRHVDQEVVEVTPVDVFEKLLHGAVQDETPPHDGAVLVGQETHGQDP
jgi:hypothetical protein